MWKNNCNRQIFHSALKPCFFFFQTLYFQLSSNAVTPKGGRWASQSEGDSSTHTRTANREKQRGDMVSVWRRHAKLSWAELCVFIINVAEPSSLNANAVETKTSFEANLRWIVKKNSSGIVLWFMRLLELICVHRYTFIFFSVVIIFLAKVSRAGS